MRLAVSTTRETAFRRRARVVGRQRPVQHREPIGIKPRAGYDEMTHINQRVLGSVVGPKEDIPTLFRLTALRRLSALDLADPKVAHTLRIMVDSQKAIDPPPRHPRE